MAFKVGDKVIPYRKVTQSKTWHDKWVISMNDYIGTIGTVVLVWNNSVQVRFNDGWSWNFPLSALKYYKG